MELNFEGNKHRPLLRENLDSLVLWSEDKHYWVHVPARELAYILNGCLKFTAYTLEKLHLGAPYILTACTTSKFIELESSINFYAQLFYAVNFQDKIYSFMELLRLFSSITVKNIFTRKFYQIYFQHILKNQSFLILSTAFAPNN